MSKICNQCNNQLEDNANFCTICGSNNIREENVIQNQNVQVTAAPMQQQPVEQPAVINDPQDINKQTQNNITLENNEAKQDFTTFEFPSSNDQVQVQEQPQQVVQQQPIQQPVQQIETPQVPVVPSDFKLQSGTDINQMPDSNNPFDESLNARNINAAANKSNKKTMKTIIITIVVTIGILIVLLAIFILFVSVSVDFKQEGLNCPSPTQIAPYQIRIGAEGYGYLTIPNTWRLINTTDGSIQYEDGTGWAVTIIAIKTETLGAATYASNVESTLQQYGGAVVKTQEKLYNYDSYKINGYVPEYQKYITAWIIEAEDGNTHYISVEGPNNAGEPYSYAQSFGICK